jgi:hypothetical protein
MFLSFSEITKDAETLISDYAEQHKKNSKRFGEDDIASRQYKDYAFGAYQVWVRLVGDIVDGATLTRMRTLAGLPEKLNNPEGE